MSFCPLGRGNLPWNRFVGLSMLKKSSYFPFLSFFTSSLPPFLPSSLSLSPHPSLPFFFPFHVGSFSTEVWNGDEFLGQESSEPGFPHGKFSNCHQIKLSSTKKTPHGMFSPSPCSGVRQTHSPDCLVYVGDLTAFNWYTFIPVMQLQFFFVVFFFHSQAWPSSLALLCKSGSDFRMY